MILSVSIYIGFLYADSHVTSSEQCDFLQERRRLGLELLFALLLHRFSPVIKLGKESVQLASHSFSAFHPAASFLLFFVLRLVAFLYLLFFLCNRVVKLLWRIACLFCTFICVS